MPWMALWDGHPGQWALGPVTDSRVTSGCRMALRDPPAGLSMFGDGMDPRRIGVARSGHAVCLDGGNAATVLQPGLRSHERLSVAARGFFEQELRVGISEQVQHRKIILVVFSLAKTSCPRSPHDKARRCLHSTRYPVSGCRLVSGLRLPVGRSVERVPKIPEQTTETGYPG
ncbi:hypothetical protein VTK73DRAFT_9418 [Phialemonium thermophilum]|uniref:Uncharacterized protein n=1 Tax=Phialemonium thermophilum TaxID=223376 RepID=A0ABR3W2G6_9PEZI